MNEKIEPTGVEAESVELIDLGDATKETRQPHPIQVALDSAITWTYFFAE